MTKEYLHSFKNNTDFETQYYSKTLIKSITCSIGTFTYDRTESYFDDNMNNIENDYIYKNGELETILFNRSIISTDGNIEVKINDEWVKYPIESIEYEDAYNGEDYHEPWVSLVDENEEVKYNKEEQGLMQPTA